MNTNVNKDCEVCHGKGVYRSVLDSGIELRCECWQCSGAYLIQDCDQSITEPGLMPIEDTE